MQSKHLVDPQLLPLLDILVEQEFSIETLPELRRLFDEQMAAMPKVEVSGVQAREFMVPADDGHSIRVLAYRPEQSKEPLPAIVHIHGGGFVVGNPNMDDADNRALCRELGCALFSIDYRLAPEHPHPVPIEDCYAALLYIYENARELGVLPNKIGVKGESAGGGLAAALALMARDRKQVPLAFQHLAYPMLDDCTCVAADPHPFTGEFVWTARMNRFGWTSLLGHAPGVNEVSPYASPGRADDLTGLPPCFMMTGTLDLFLEEDLEYARRLIRAGVPMELHVYPGAFHAFDFQKDADVTAQFRVDSLAALRRSLGA